MSVRGRIIKGFKTMKHSADFVRYIFYVLVGGAIIWLINFINRNLGDTAMLAFIFLFVGWIIGIATAVIGSKINDQGQKAFIQGLGQLKTIMAPTIRENARTQGLIEREQIKAELRKTDDGSTELDAFFSEYQ